MTTIRDARRDDADRIVEIWAAAVDATHHFLTHADRAAIEREVREHLPAAPLRLAVDGNDRALGFMLVAEGRLEALFVHPDDCGRGVGRSLVAEALAAHPRLSVDVNEQNDRALGFYDRLGFVRTGRSDRDDAGRPYPLLHLRHDGKRASIESAPDGGRRGPNRGAGGGAGGRTQDARAVAAAGRVVRRDVGAAGAGARRRGIGCGVIIT